MAETAPSAVMVASPTHRPLHPFFAPNRMAPHVVENEGAESLTHAGMIEDSSSIPINTKDTKNTGGDVAVNPESEGDRKKRRSMNSDTLEGEEPQKQKANKRARVSGAGSIASHFIKVVPGKPCTADAPELMARHDGLSTSQPSSNLSSISTASIELSARGTAAPKPKKFLLFDPKTGTIGPSPEPKVTPTVEGAVAAGEKQAPKRRGRKARSMVVCLKYGTDLESRTRIGTGISSILTTTTSHSAVESEGLQVSAPKKSSPKAPKAAALASSKSTHPFFLGTVKKQDIVPEDAKPSEPSSPRATTKSKIFGSTPFSPKKPRSAPVPKASLPQFGVKNLGLKFPGAKPPAWPWQGMVHVRGNQDQPEVTGSSEVWMTDDKPLPLAARKSKGHSVKVAFSESALAVTAQTLNIESIVKDIRNINTDVVTTPPLELRLPRKHFESGSKLQARILPELKTFRIPTPGKKGAQRKLFAENADGKAQPPVQLSRLFKLISSSLSAFDKSQCETANWVQKYAPTCAAEVLQPGQEAFLLKEWLQTLVVQSVDTGSKDDNKVSPRTKAKQGKKKRRRRLDGFIVSSDDEDYRLDDLSGDEADWTASGARGILRKTVIRSLNLGKGEKIANTLVISGPPGCGKTAMVHAVANELDFEIFEINSSTRRAGKDVLAKIGDMTRNHHVRQHQSGDSGDGDHAAGEDNTANDIKAGKQSTMASFFKPKPPAAAKPKPSAVMSDDTPALKDLKKSSSRSQRQSLILLEEVDVLYEEDKQFWTTVVDLITQSRRPFIMTCNDETLVPLHILRMHGIFRLSPPPRDFAIDRLILVAANEGHVLARQAVETLYDSRNCDIRAATMDLQYWCQIGVGDRRGGFDWFYPRWPKGADLDENKEVVRVISEGTYQPGMNLLARDSIVSDKTTPLHAEEELVEQAWDSWGVDLGNWEDSLRLSTWAEKIKPVSASPAGRLGALEAFGEMAEALSVADVCSLGSFATHKEERMDATQPEPSDKGQNDLIQGLPYLNSPFTTYYDSLVTSVPSAIKSLAKASLKTSMNALHNSSADELRPLTESQGVQCLQTSFASPTPGSVAITRIDFAFAFDNIATAESSSAAPVSHLDPSVLDRTLKLIVLDVAPYVRGIVAYEQFLQKQRLKMSNLVSEGGQGTQGTKRMRTTRAALSAMEGGSRSNKRGERWFKAELNPYLVARTGGKGWNPGLDLDELPFPPSPLKRSPLKSSTGEDASPETSPVKPKKAAGKRGRKPKVQKVVVDEDTGSEAHEHDGEGV
ncbi:hypothetical protein QBC36DRAFT_325780 [Triangularia setosa]|uniref:AAA+ ATPase domain-containing protein n=1 Tax=Triangularia setosa TaxID=2587417 RepID=A0AAN6WBF7_9PEZI|nr:hypothetical protein QBC36DRAFT_325780 [Podospora setosa]